jgi:hypothetical protein
MAAAGLVIFSGGADAQVRCPEGKTFTGACVNPGLANILRQTAIIFAQPKISYTAYPVLPSGDGGYRYPNQLNPDPAKPSPTGPTTPAGTVIIIF